MDEINWAEHVEKNDRKHALLINLSLILFAAEFQIITAE